MSQPVLIEFVAWIQVTGRALIGEEESPLASI
jgi:hypothetical protein